MTDAGDNNLDRHEELEELELTSGEFPAATDNEPDAAKNEAQSVDTESEDAQPAPYAPYVPEIRMPRQVVRGRRRRERTPALLRSPLMYPLVFVGVMLAVFGWNWFTTPIENEVTGQTRTRWQTGVSMARNIVNPKMSLEKSFEGKQHINVLLIGLDHVPVTKKDPGIIRRNDSNLVVSTGFDNKQIRIASIPRDGWVQHWQNGTNFGYDKFGHSYSLGQQYNLRRKEDIAQGGVGRVKETTEHLFDIEIDHYVVIEFEGFIQLIDAMGGLEVDVEKNMKYSDRAAGLHIDLKKGLQHLNGEQVMQYARFRKDAMGDKGRMMRQQKVIKLAMQKMASPKMLPRLPEIARLFNESVKTDLTADQLLALVQHVDGYNMDEVESESLPSYWAREPGHERMLPGVSAENQSSHTSDEYISPGDVKKMREFLTDLNAPPRVVASLNRETARAPFTATIDASESSDRDGSVVSYEVDWNGDGNFEIQSESAQISRDFPTAGEFSMNVRVIDDKGKASQPQKLILKLDPPGEQAAAHQTDGNA